MVDWPQTHYVICFYMTLCISASDWFTHLLIDSLSEGFAQCVVDSLYKWLIQWLHWLTDSLGEWLIRSVTD